METDMDIDHLREWIGREQTAQETLTATRAAQFTASFDASPVPATADYALLGIHLCLAQPAAPMAELGRDGHPSLGGFLPPVPLPRRMWAGGAFAFHAPIRVGETITRHSAISDVAVKEGRSGALCFVTVQHSITADGREAVTERQDIVYRGMPASGSRGGGGQAGAESAPPPTGRYRRTITPHPTLLFRYSAMTFNGHRIHYDRAFAVEEEGYPGLVVHGPLQATLLCRFAAENAGATPRHFTFRSRAAVFDTGDFELHAGEMEGDAMPLWTAAKDTPVAMEARATWGAA